MSSRTPTLKTSSSRGPKCPICGEPTVTGFRPFCSRRCADVDLSRWMNGVYAIPVTDADADEDGDDVGAEMAAYPSARQSDGGSGFGSGGGER